MCGEHDTTCTRSPRDTGSSPHVRGAHSTRPSAHCRTGIIPACAGSTLKVSGRLRFAWDYPRMCGEHIVANRNCGSVQGSSPHVRGARAGRARPAGPSGIIPACAGSTVEQLFLTTVIGDHPRMCGEHCARHVKNCSIPGSSPHVRGAHNIVGHLIHITGIIPACAGSTFDMIEILRQIGDHPRMCGEHVRRQSVRQLLTGIIPACAGSTQTHRLHDQPRRDHPRMCGEHDVRPDRRQS